MTDTLHPTPSSPPLDAELQENLMDKIGGTEPKTFDDFIALLDKAKAAGAAAPTGDAGAKGAASCDKSKAGCCGSCDKAASCDKSKCDGGGCDKSKAAGAAAPTGDAGTEGGLIRLEDTAGGVEVGLVDAGDGDVEQASPATGGAPAP